MQLFTRGTLQKNYGIVYNIWYNRGEDNVVERRYNMITEIYYFTSTGNSLKVARDLGSKLEKVKFISIASVINKDEVKTDADSIGIVCPVYWLGLPNIVIGFISKLKARSNAYVFGLVTYGSMPGQSLYQLKKILISTGNHLSAAFDVKMPDNYQIIYKVPSWEEQLKYFSNEEKKTIEIADIIKKRQTNIIDVNNISRAAAAILNKKVISGTYKKDMNFKVSNSCNKCGLCSRICPVNNISIEEKGPVWKHNCELCLACLQWCPTASIEYGRKTINKGRYHHPDINVTDIIVQK